MITANRVNRGFTIVELLIVIVVIAILAAISIVSYNGIRERTNNTQTATAVSSYVKALNMYRTDKGEYPDFDFCLGMQYDANGCRSNISGMVNNKFINTVSLRPYFGGSVPEPAKTATFTSGSFQIKGAFYIWKSTYYNADGAAFGVIIHGSSCPEIGGVGKAISRLGSSDGSQTSLCRYVLQ